MASKTLSINIVGDARGARKAFDDVEKRASGFGSKMAGFGKKLATIGLVGGTALAGGLALGLKDAYKEALDSAKIGKETNRVIFTTGGVANVTAAAVSKLSTAISNKTGVDDEQIQSGANLLLTFTGVRNELGKGNDVFNQATSLALDMSKVMKTDLKGSVVQVGKALNDPVKGLTALSRAGVSFTAQQKAQIKALTEAGDKLGAQKIILAELKREFGGAAAAASTPFDKLKVNVKNLEEAFGAKLIPIVNRAATWLAKNLPVAVTRAGELFDKVRPKIQQVGVQFGKVVDAVRPLVARVVEFFKSDPDARFAALAAVIGGVVVGAVVALGAALAAAFAPVYLVIAGVALLAAGLVYAYKHFEGFRNVVDTVARGLKAAFVGVVGWFKTNWPTISAVVKEVAGLVSAYLEWWWGNFQKFLGFIRVLWRAVGDDLLRLARDVWPRIQESIGNALTVIRGLIQFFTALFKGDWGKAWDALKKIAAGLLRQLGNVVLIGMAAVHRGFTAVLSLLKAAWSGVWHGLKGVAIKALNGVLSGITSIINRIIGVINSAIGAFNKIPGVPDIGKVPTLDAPSFGSGGGSSSRPNLASVSGHGVGQTHGPRSGGVTINGPVHVHAKGESATKTLNDLHRNTRITAGGG